MTNDKVNIYCPNTIPRYNKTHTTRSHKNKLLYDLKIKSAKNKQTVPTISLTSSCKLSGSLDGMLDSILK